MPIARQKSYSESKRVAHPEQIAPGPAPTPAAAPVCVRRGDFERLSVVIPETPVRALALDLDLDMDGDGRGDED